MEEDDSASHKFLNLIKEKREVFFYVSETYTTLNKVNKGV